MLAPIGKTNTPQGAVAFARYWMGALDWGYATTSSALARQLYLPSCAGCGRFLTNMIDSTREARQHFSGGRLSVTSAHLITNDHHAGASIVIELTVNQSALQVRRDAGTVIETDHAITGNVSRTWLRWVGGRWFVADWKRVVKK